MPLQPLSHEETEARYRAEVARIANAPQARRCACCQKGAQWRTAECAEWCESTYPPKVPTRRNA